MVTAARTTQHRFLKAHVVKRILNDLIPRGQIFTITFIKENGELRMMNCRRGVSAHVQRIMTDEERSAGRPNRTTDVMRVFDLKENDYRSFHTGKVIIIKTSGILIQAAEED